MLRQNVQLKNSTWLNVGGPVDVLYKANNLSDLVSFIKNNQSQVAVIGVGSNILVSDEGFRGTVIRLGRGFTRIVCNDNHITVGAAALDYNVAHFAMQNGIGGLEFLVGIPGTIGGALAMNAGCYGKDISSILVSATVVDDRGNIMELNPDEIGYVYRGNKLPSDWVFVEATLRGVKSHPEMIKGEMDKITIDRQRKQPISSKTCGSIFKNPPGHKAWELIEKSGFRGKSLGKAQISELHCNFLINNGGATASDLTMLCNQVREAVKKKSAIELEWEIILLGN